MMLYIPSKERGVTELKWLKSHHSFSFGDYFNPEMISFKNLRVINEDYIAPCSGFPLHPHENMEIITYIIKGELEHRDNLSNRTIISEGEIQKMSAGVGIVHSEKNLSKTDQTHLLQIWIFPKTKNLTPEYEQKRIQDFPKEDTSPLTLIASPQGAHHTIQIHQDIKLYKGEFNSHEPFELKTEKKNSLWIQVISGEINVGIYTLKAGDAIAINAETRIQFEAKEKTHLLLFDQF